MKQMRDIQEWPKQFTKQWAAEYIYSAYRWQVLENNEDAWRILHTLFMEANK